MWELFSLDWQLFHSECRFAWCKHKSLAFIYLCISTCLPYFPKNKANSSQKNSSPHLQLPSAVRQSGQHKGALPSSWDKDTPVHTQNPSRPPLHRVEKLAQPAAHIIMPPCPVIWWPLSGSYPRCKDWRWFGWEERTVCEDGARMTRQGQAGVHR